MSSKIAIVAGEGGLRGGFVAGALSEVYEYYDLGQAALISASSASVAGLLYHFSHGREHPAKYFWTEALTAKEFVDPIKKARILRGNSVLNLDYLVDVAIKRDKPYILDGIFNTPQPYYFPVVDYNTRETIFLTNKKQGHAGSFRCEIRELSPDNLYKYIKAAKAAPVLYDKTVEVDGHEYFDGGMREPFTLDLPGMEDAKILLVVTNKFWSFKGNINYLLLGSIWWIRSILREKGRLDSWVYVDLIKRYQVNMRLLNKVRELEKQGRLLLISPEQVSSNASSPDEIIKEGYEHGVSTAKLREAEIKSFLGI